VEKGGSSNPTVPKGCPKGKKKRKRPLDERGKLSLQSAKSRETGGANFAEEKG